MTRQRKVVFDIIQESHDHLTADQIYTAAKQVLPSISVGTVYRNLKLMTEAGEIRRLVVPDGPDHYDNLNTQHDHAICVMCGRIFDIAAASWVRDPGRALPDFTVVGYELTVKCICGKCQTAQA